MTFFYNKPIQFNAGTNLPITKPVQTPPYVRSAFGPAFNYEVASNDVFGKASSPLNASEEYITQLALNNPRIMKIVNEKLCKY